MSIAKKLMTVGGKDSLYVDDVFSTYLYSGDGGTQTITNGLDLSGEDGLVWLKKRSGADNHFLYDTLRGATKTLKTDSTAAEATDSTALTGFNGNGFTLGADPSVNQAGAGYASWTFLKAPGFFDIVKYTGTASGAGITIPHNLGTTPGVIIVKPLVQAGNWHVYHKNVGANQVMYLNYDSPSATNSGFFPQAPDENNFYVGAQLNQSDEYVAYIFAHDDSDESLIKCGIATYNGSAPTEVDLGFEPQFILLKSATVSEDWYMVDCMRGLSGTVNGPSNRLNANKTDAEYEVPYLVSANSNGFTIGTGAPSARQYIYMAIRRPNKPAKEFEPEELFAVDNGDGTIPGFVSGFPVDGAIRRFNVTTSDNHELSSRLTSGNNLFTNSTSAESVSGTTVFDYMNGYRSDAGATNDYAWMWRRAPGSFDVVTYDGTNGSRNLPHNLGVVPTMIWTKMRDGAEDWCVIHGQNESDMSNIVTGLSLNTPTAAQVVDQDYSAVHTASTFNPKFIKPSTNVGDGASTGKHIAYLFASVPGISKTGGYTGTGATQYIDVGFTNSCRFVLIKRVDAAGDWMVVDTERGFISGMNPYIYLNNNSPQEYTFRVYPYPQGFQLSDDASVNADGGEYLFYAIA